MRGWWYEQVEIQYPTPGANVELLENINAKLENLPGQADMKKTKGHVEERSGPDDRVDYASDCSDRSFWHCQCIFSNLVYHVG